MAAAQNARRQQEAPLHKELLSRHYSQFLGFGNDY
jgi:hypothetical protein